MAKERTVKADAPEPEPARDANPRISLPLNDSGGIAWDKMRESTKASIFDKLRNDPQLRGTGAAPAPAAPAGDVFSEPMAGMLFDLLGQVEVSIAMGAFHCDRQAASVMLYTEPEKAMLTGPLTRVLNKYGSTWLAKYGDEIALASLFVAVNAPKVMALQERRAAGVLREPAAPAAPGGPRLVPVPAASANTEPALNVKGENAEN